MSIDQNPLQKFDRASPTPSASVTETTTTTTTMAPTASTMTTTRKAMSTSKAAAVLASCVPAGGGVSRDDDRKRKIWVPKGYLPIVLVRGGGGDDDDDNGKGGAGTETRVLVRVSDLKEPCMAALLEAAEEQFGYGQHGVLKVPCDAQRFHHVVSIARNASPKK